MNPNPQSQTPFMESRLLQLDALRAFAILAVLAQHYLPYEYLGGILWGRLGVRLFFVISGFLITSILLDIRHAGLSRGRALGCFYMRRVLRLVPIYYLGLLIVAWVHEGVRGDLGWHVAYLSNIRAAMPGNESGPVSHLWSLSVEEQFYLLWPWVVLFAPRAGLAVILAATLLIGPAYRYVAWSQHWGHAMQLWQLPACCDSLGAGAVIAFLRSGYWPRIRAAIFFRGALVVGLPLVAYAYLQKPTSPVLVIWGDTGASLAFACLVWRASHGFGGQLGAILENRALRFVGQISYGIYIIHYLLPFLWNQLAVPYWGLTPVGHSVISAVLFTATSFILATASWYWIEQPVLGLKKFFPYHRKPRD